MLPRSTTTPTIATATAVSTIAGAHRKSAIAWSPSTRNLGPNADQRRYRQSAGSGSFQARGRVWRACFYQWSRYAKQVPRRSARYRRTVKQIFPCEPRVATGFRDPSCAHQPRRIDGTIGSANSPTSRSFLSVTWLTCPARTVGYERHTRPHLRGLRFGGRYGCYRKIAFSCVSRNSV
jgi:hypothetical protein